MNKPIKMPAVSPGYREPAHHEIVMFAHSIWEAEGRPEGRDVAHWFEAKAHLVASRKMDAGMFSLPKAGKSTGPSMAGETAETGARKRRATRTTSSSPGQRQEKILTEQSI